MTSRRPKFLTHALAFGLACGAAACDVPPDGHDVDLNDGTPLTETQAPLYLRDVPTWAINNNVVPLCWMTSGYTREKTMVQNAVARTWGAETSLQFQWTASCPTSGTAKFVKMKIIEGNMGTSFVGINDSLRLPTDGESILFRFKADGSISQSRVEYLGVHEIGHALGFFHEQDRPENEDGVFCEDTVFTDYTGIIETLFDPTSVMNYCGPGTGTLTKLDVAGARQVYARAKVSVAGTTSDGRLWHTMRAESGTWAPFADVEAEAGDIGAVKRVDMRYTRKGLVHVAAVNGTGNLMHTIRNPTVWDKFADVETQTGDMGTISDVALADAGDDMHVVAVNTAGGLFHTIRVNATKVWQPKGDVKVAAQGTGSFVSAGASTIGDDLHVCGVTYDGKLWHTIRRPTSWDKLADVGAELSRLGTPVGTVKQVDCVGISGRLHVVMRSSDGKIRHTVRKLGGWTPAEDVNAKAGTLAAMADLSVSQQAGTLHVSVNADGKAWHTTRNSRGVWKAFADVEAQAGDRGTFSSVGLE